MTSREESEKKVNKVFKSAEDMIACFELEKDRPFDDHDRELIRLGIRYGVTAYIEAELNALKRP